MKITLDSANSLADTLRVIEAVHQVTLTVSDPAAEGATTGTRRAGTSPPRKRAVAAKRAGTARRARKPKSVAAPSNSEVRV